MSDELIEDIEANDGPPKAEERFGLSEALEMFPKFVAHLTVPRKQKDWDRKIGNEWAQLRSGFADKRAGTQKLYISKFRKAVKDEIIKREKNPERVETLFDELVEKFLVIDPEIIEEINRESAERIKKQVQNLTPIAKWAELMDEFRSLLRSSDPRYIVLGLMAVTGRRSFEVLSSGNFARAKVTTDSGAIVVQRYEVAFSGQAKTREAKGSRFGQTFNIPVNADAVDVLDAFGRLRKSAEGKAWAKMGSTELNKRFNKLFNRALRGQTNITRLLGDWPASEPEISIGDLRALYAEVAYKLHAPAKIIKNAYFAMILGHSEDDYRSSLNYMRFSLGEDRERAARKEIKRVQALYAEQQKTIAADRKSKTAST